VQSHAQKLRADAYLAKPFDLDELLGKVSSLMGNGGSQAARA
jgi:DNA-binding response OmpR family regulator